MNNVNDSSVHEISEYKVTHYDLWDFRLASRSSWGLCPFGMLRAVCCLLDTVVSGQDIGPMWKTILKMALMCCPETSVTSYQHIQRNIPQAETSECNLFTLSKICYTGEGCRTCHNINSMICNAIQVLNAWVVQVFVVILQEYHIKQNKI